MNDLEIFFDQGTGERSHKWRHYFEIYDRYLSKFRAQKCTYLEIGIEHGGTLDIMRKYLGAQTRIIGVDIDASCKALDSHGYEIHIGDQGNKEFVDSLGRNSGPFDIIIDDGGHTPDQQITSFYALFPYLKEGGVYLVEDMHANLWASHQKSRYGLTFFDVAKGLADKLTYMHLDPRSFEVFRGADAPDTTTIDNFATTDIYGIHFYDSVIVFEKRRRERPFAERK